MRALFLVSAALFAIACSNEGDPGACKNDHDATCIEYPRAQGAAGKRMCSSEKKWLPGEKACPKENRLGTCLKEGGKVSSFMYGGPPNNYTASAAKNACEWGGGVFTASASSATPSASASAK